MTNLTIQNNPSIRDGIIEGEISGIFETYHSKKLRTFTTSNSKEKLCWLISNYFIKTYCIVVFNRSVNGYYKTEGNVYD